MSDNAAKATQQAKASGDSSSGGSALSLKANAPEFVPPAAAPKSGGPQQGQKQHKKGTAMNPNSAKAKPFNPPAGAAKLSTTVNAAPFVPAAPGGKPAPANPKMSVAAASFIPKSPTAAPPAVPPPPRSQDHKPADAGYNQGGHLQHHHHHQAGGYQRPSHPGRRPYPPQPGPYRSDAPPPPGGRGRGRGRDGGRGPGRGANYGMGVAQGAGGFHLLGPGRAQIQSRFASEQLRQQLQQRSYLALSQWVPPEGDELGIPEKIQNYHSIYPLENTPAAHPLPSSVLGVASAVYKGVSSHDGAAYCLRHIDGRQVVPSSDLVAAARAACEAWARLREHPNLVALRGTFLSDEIGGAQSLFLVHDYHPGAVTLAQAHMQATSTATGLVRNAATEEQLWSYLVQLCQATSAVHGCGLAFRPGGLAPSKVLLTGFGRIRVGGVGVMDVLQGAGQKEREREEEMGLLQLQDLVGIGQLVLLLACSSAPGGPAMDYLQAHFSRDLTHTVGVLLGAGEGRGCLSSIGELRVMLGERAFGELYSQQSYVDSMVAELAKEVENGRLLRLLIKLGFISERPDGTLDGSWSETGDRYLLKLFQDWVFHQVSEEGAPLLDWGHVLEALNKVDAGVPEKILLLGRDEQSLLVASYADLKRCLESSFNELKSAAAAGRHAASNRRPGPPDYSHDHGHSHGHH